MSKDKNQAIIFDFDGVLADSFEIFVTTLSELLGKPPLGHDVTQQLRGSSTREILKRLDIKKWQIPKLIRQGRRRMFEKMPSVEVFKGTEEMLKSTSKNYRLYILSTNDQQAIAYLLGKYGLTSHITKIYSGTSIFGKSKRLASLLKKEKLLVRNCIYIGDETRDIEAAHAIHMKCIAVGWGYCTPAILKTYNPDAFIAKPNQIEKTVKQLLQK
ncbi:MAG TPA: HAD-IA family hydrolase [Candidatus Saccharimonadales bacterium]|nr:HAD-IA family hydrolase [Candidatus Saccharimonadales bacterium]